MPCSRAAQVALLQALAFAAFGSIGAAAASAQVHVASLDELRRALNAGDFINIVAADGQRVEGQLMRIGWTDLIIRPGRVSRRPGGGDVTMTFDAIQSLERHRDPVGNGVRWGAGIGAVSGGVLFLGALITDRNEIDEWAGPYAVAAAAFTGVGALIGWTIDAAASKPPLRFDVQPSHTRGRGLSIAFQVRYRRSPILTSNAALPRTSTCLSSTPSPPSGRTPRLR